jgi:TUP1-like enhancer of split
VSCRVRIQPVPPLQLFEGMAAAESEDAAAAQELSVTVAEPRGALAPAGAPSERVLLASNAQRIHRGRAVADLACVHAGWQQWRTALPSHVTALAGAPAWAAAALQDGTLVLLTRAGRRAAPPLALAAPIVLLVAAGDAKLAALLANADFCVWDVLRRKVRCCGQGSTASAGRQSTRRSVPCALRQMCR